MLKKGIYEKVINQDIKSQIEETQSANMICLKQSVDLAESPQILANYLANAIRQKLEETEDQQDRVNMINNILMEVGLMDEMKIVDTNNLLSEVKNPSQQENNSNSSVTDLKLKKM